jgi:hypothetical protein
MMKIIHEGRALDDFGPRDTLPAISWNAASCGISTVYTLPVYAAGFVKFVIGPRKPPDRREREAFILFSDYSIGRGAHIADFIKDRPWLGPITETPERINPNTGNRIKAWIWAVNYNDSDVITAQSGIFLDTLFTRNTGT